MFWSVFGTFAHKVAQTRFDLHETWHPTLFGIYYCVEVVRIENHFHMLEITFKLRFYAFLSDFATFAHKLAQTWFDLHETWHTILLEIYYCVEIVRIVNHCHMVEITC